MKNLKPIDELLEFTGMIQEAINALQRLETFKEMLQPTIQTGKGVNEQSIAILLLTVHGLCERLGLSNPVLPKRELMSFKKKKDRLAATQTVLNFIEEMIALLWKTTTQGLTVALKIAKKNTPR